VTRLGQRSPVHATASGQILLSDLPGETVDQIIVQTGLKRFTARTIISASGLKKRLMEVRKHGYVVANAEYKPDLCVIATPIRDHHGKVSAALMTALHSERARRSKALVNQIVDILKREALLISHQIGYQGTPQ